MSESAVAFIDLLGFSNAVNNNTTLATEILGDFYEIVYQTKKDRLGDSQYYLVSDSLIVWSSDWAGMVSFLCEVYRKCLRKTIEYNKIDKILLPRGGLSVGSVISQERHTQPRDVKAFIISPALVSATDIEKNMKGARLVIAVKNENENKKIYWNTATSSILYETQSINGNNKCKYFDALWFSDLSLEHDDKKEQTELLFRDYLIFLVLNKDMNPKILPQYTETFRIGLLSYARFLEPVITTPNWLMPIFSDFIDDKFWMIWLSIMEAYLFHGDEWALCKNKDFVNFFHQICTRSGWGEALNYLKKLKNDSLHNKITDFSLTLADNTFHE
jgi:hypothetical protein